MLFGLVLYQNILVPAIDSLNLKSQLQSNNIFHLLSHSHGFNFMISVIDIRIIFDTIFDIR